MDKEYDLKRHELENVLYWFFSVVYDLKRNISFLSKWGADDDNCNTLDI